ncbi:Heat shock protein 70 [Stanieria sp. NIES-3757]|nr:Heat shock protein 70 [Stanieria sp. NIES-3757]
MSVTPIENNAYAIDFGTSNTVVARWNSAINSTETVKLPGLSQLLANNPPLIPSLVYVEDASQGKVILGQTVRDRGLDQTNDARFFRSFKRGIGTEIQGFLPELDEQLVTFEQVGEWFLKQLIEQLQADCQANLQSLVLTVPVDSFEAYRLWLTDICHSLNVEQIRILDEPTAAALGYGAAEQELILVVDFGGGTVDLSLVQLSRQSQVNQGFILKWGQKFLGESSSQKKTTARVLAKAGQNLGGTDIDHWLVDYFAATEGLTKSSLTTRLAEKLKIQLSTRQEASEAYFNDETLESYQLNLDRSSLEKILQEQQFFAQLDELMTQVLQQARRNGIEKTDINAVLLVGGTVQMPAVQNWIKQYFDEDKIRCDRPFDAIATGALAIAQGIQVQDFLYHSYGIRYWNRKQNCHSWHPIIQAGQPYPMAQPVELVLGASVENQPSIELIIGEMGVNNVGVEVYFDGDRLITRNTKDQTMTVKPLNDKPGASTIAKLEPLGNPGSDRVKISFRVDQERYLRLSVEDLLTQTMLLNNQIVAELT